MRRTLLALVLMLGFGLVLTTPADAAEQPLAAESLEELLQPEEPNLTPVEPDVLDPGGSLRVNRIYGCSAEEPPLCPAGCGCLVIRNEVNCYC
jgi:hypothetical protein